MSVRCPNCGSPRVQALLWVERVEDGDDFDTECFCPDCDEGFRFSALRCACPRSPLTG